MTHPIMQPLPASARPYYPDPADRPEEPCPCDRGQHYSCRRLAVAGYCCCPENVVDVDRLAEIAAQR